MLVQNESKGVKRDKANSEILTARKIEEIASPIMQLAFGLSGNVLGKAYFKEPFNAFIFTKESVLKYFHGAENIPTLKLDPKAAEFLVVITGAHDVDEEHFFAGQRTAIICGMQEEKDADGNAILKDGNQVLKVADPRFVIGEVQGSSADPDIADEYPPHEIMEHIPKSLVGGFFKIVVNK